MKRQAHIFAILLCLAGVSLSGCRRNIVLASPPASVATPPLPVTQPDPVALEPRPAPPAADVALQPEVPAEPTPAPTPAPTATPAPRPRPAPVEAEAKPKPEPEPEPTPAAPQIVPQLRPQEQANAERTTNDNITTAERNLQHAAESGQKLSASQNDLIEKIRGFLSQAHEAILMSDWVRAQNLAQKAETLSLELRKSLP